MKHLLHSHSSLYYAPNALRVLFITDEAFEIRLAVMTVSQPKDELVDLSPHALRRRRHRADPANLHDAIIDTSQLIARHERKHNTPVQSWRHILRHKSAAASHIMSSNHSADEPCTGSAAHFIS